MPASSDIQNKIIANYRKLPDDVKALIPNETGTTGNDYVAALDAAFDLNQRNYVIQKYLLDMYGSGSKIADFDGCLKNLTKIYEELGLMESENPFIRFMTLDSGKYLKLITPQNLVNLNNWYSDGLIDFNDISGMSTERLEHPIFKEDFYKLKDSGFVLKAYNFLDNVTNLKKLNYAQLFASPTISSGDPLKTIGATYNTKEKAEAITEREIEAIRKAFIYLNAAGTSFRDSNDLKQALTLVSRERPGGAGSSRGSTRVSSDVRRMMGGLSEDERLEVISDLIGAYGIDIDDLRS